MGPIQRLYGSLNSFSFRYLLVFLVQPSLEYYVTIFIPGVTLFEMAAIFIEISYFIKLFQAFTRLS